MSHHNSSYSSSHSNQPARNSEEKQDPNPYSSVGGAGRPENVYYETNPNAFRTQQAHDPNTRMDTRTYQSEPRNYQYNTGPQDRAHYGQGAQANAQSVKPSGGYFSFSSISNFIGYGQNDNNRTKSQNKSPQQPKGPSPWEIEEHKRKQKELEEEEKRKQKELEEDQRKVAEISPPMLELVNRIKLQLPSSVFAQKTKLKVIKSTKVRPGGILSSLRKFQQYCKSDNVRAQVAGVIDRIEQSLPRGEGLSEVFTCAEQSPDATQFEFMCLAVRVYKHNGEQACDFALSTYAHNVALPEWTAALGAIDNQQQHPIKKLVEALFFNELIEGGYATVDNQRRLFIAPD